MHSNIAQEQSKIYHFQILNYCHYAGKKEEENL